MSIVKKLAFSLVWMALWLSPSLGLSQSQPASAFQGFGAKTPGGLVGSVYRVSNLNDSGSGSLRDALSRGNRRIVFDVGGEIYLNTDIRVKEGFITVDGFTAPPPGITLQNHGLLITGERANNIIIRGIRSRNSNGCDTCKATGNGIVMTRGAHNIVIDRVSIQGFSDQAISVGKGAHDITISWSIFAEGRPSHNLVLLIAPLTRRISFHHNVLIKGYQRMPQVKWSNTGGQAPETQIDIRNNLIWDWGSVGSQIWKGTKANLVNNFYYDPDALTESTKKRAIYFCQPRSTAPQCDGPSNPDLWAQAYISGNISGHGPEITDYLNSLGTESTPFPAPPVTTRDACTAARQVLSDAGVRPLDAVDQGYLMSIQLPSCPAGRP